jgi:hypothetical protein
MLQTCPLGRLPESCRKFRSCRDCSTPASQSRGALLVKCWEDTSAKPAHIASRSAPSSPQQRGCEAKRPNVILCLRLYQTSRGSARILQRVYWIRCGSRGAASALYFSTVCFQPIFIPPVSAAEITCELLGACLLSRIEGSIRSSLSRVSRRKTSKTEPMGVEKEVIKQGDGKSFPTRGQRLSMHYTGTLASNGAK